MERPVDGLLVKNFEPTDEHREFSSALVASLNQGIQLARRMYPDVEMATVERQKFIVESIALFALGLVNSSINEGLLSDAVSHISKAELDQDWSTDE